MAVSMNPTQTAEDPAQHGTLANIRRNIETLMALRGIRSKEALAVATGMKKSRLYDRFNGAHPEWTATELAAVAQALHVSAGDLFEDPETLFDPGSRTGSNRNGWGLIVNPEPDQAEDRVPPTLTLVR